MRSGRATCTRPPTHMRWGNVVHLGASARVAVDARAPAVGTSGWKSAQCQSAGSTPVVEHGGVDVEARREPRRLLEPHRVVGELDEPGVGEGGFGGLAVIRARPRSATTPSSCSLPISAAERSSTSASTSSVCMPSSGAGAGATGGSVGNFSGDAGVRSMPMPGWSTSPNTGFVGATRASRRRAAA